MNYYKVAVLSSPLEPLTYSYEEDLKVGESVKIKLRNKQKEGVVVEKTTRPDFSTLAIQECSSYFYSAKQLHIASFIAKYYICSIGDALGVFVPYSKKTSDQPAVLPPPLKKIQLSKEQTQAFEAMQKHSSVLLFGATGSGKTELYISYFQTLIQQKKRVLLLLPEISLTPQMQNRLEEYFGSTVMMWHSKLTKKQKQDNLERLYSNEIYVVAGPRSALFLPIENLGIIVVDEEHDESYKSNARPRYNARDVALYMGKEFEIPVVLGSATPTLGSFIKHPVVRLKKTYFKAKRTFIYEKSPQSLSPSLMAHLQKNLYEQNQAIVFIPTRANFKYLQCKECGESFRCGYCDVGMSLHSEKNALVCHYCGFMQKIPQICPSCKSEHLVSSRIGTAEVAKELQKEFGGAKIAQFDRDVVTTQAKLKKLLTAFNNKEIEILVGTQMLSKGHDYHGITLAVVLGLDAQLNHPDYRAREKALALLVQIAGRSGRKLDAKVVVQTYNQEFFQAYVEDYEAFLEEEQYYREGMYPPYKKLARVTFAHTSNTKALAAMQSMREQLECYSELVEIVGSGECAITKVANKYRYEILLRSNRSTTLIQTIRKTMVPLAEVDIDPLEFL